MLGGGRGRGGQPEAGAGPHQRDREEAHEDRGDGGTARPWIPWTRISRAPAFILYDTQTGLPGRRRRPGADAAQERASSGKKTIAQPDHPDHGRSGARGLPCALPPRVLRVQSRPGHRGAVHRRPEAGRLTRAPPPTWTAAGDSGDRLRQGGTGKTTVALNLARVMAAPVQLLDCDVEEPNTGLFLGGTRESRETVESRAR